MPIDPRTCDPHALPASEELDALMATEVMGWRSWNVHPCYGWYPSTNAAHAGELRKTADQSMVCHVDQVFAVVAIGSEVGSAVVLYTETDGDKANAEALAICRAFAAYLKAKAERGSDD